MANSFQLKRGLQTNLPIGLEGEPLFTTDTKRLYLSDGVANNLLQGASVVLTEGAIPFSDSDGKLNMDASNIYWDNTNKRLGIGTTVPGTYTGQLVVADGTSAKITIAQNSVGAFLQLMQYNNGAYILRDNGDSLHFGTKASSSTADASLVSQMNLDTTGKLTVEGDVLINGGDLDFPVNGLISADGLISIASANSWVGLTSATGDHQYFNCGNQFRWRDVDDGFAVRMTLDAGTGNLGIGTPNPLRDLHIEGGSPEIQFKDTDGDGTLWHMGQSTNDFRFVETGVADRMTIQKGGNVGIGTTNPDEKLEVDGNIHIAEDGFIGIPGDSRIIFDGSGNKIIAESIAGFVISRSGVNSYQFSSSSDVISDVLTVNSIDTAKEIMRFGADQRVIYFGEVGIGTTNPTEKLEVNGNLFLNTDNNKLYLGAGKDTSIYYDGTNAIIDTGLINASDLVVDCGTDKTIELQESVWDDQQVDIGKVKLGSSAPTWTSYKGAQVLAFSKSQDNSASFNLQLTHRYKLGTNIEFHIHDTPADDTAGDVRWTLSVSLADINGDFPAPTTYTAVQTIDLNTADKHIFFEISDNIGTSSGVSSVALLTLTRTGTHADDDYDNDMYLVALDAHIEINTMGSRQEATK